MISTSISKVYLFFLASIMLFIPFTGSNNTKKTAVERNKKDIQLKKAQIEFKAQLNNDSQRVARK